MVSRSTTGPPRAKLFELDVAVRVGVDTGEGGANLRNAVADTQRIEQLAKLRFVDRAVAVPIHALEAASQRIYAHHDRLRRFGAPTNRGLLLLLACALASCKTGAEIPQNAAANGSTVADDKPRQAPPQAAAGERAASPALAPLSGSWLEHLSEGETEVFVTPPLGAVAPSRLMIAVHGAGDRPEWSCGGWRVVAHLSAFVVCPQGARLTPQTFAWVSERQLSDRITVALRVAQARYAPYVDSAPFIFAGFSQGATFAEPFLRKHAAEFPIAILAEGGYATARSPAFASAFYTAGGRRIVLVCGSDACFRSATSSRKVLEKAGLEVLVIGDVKAGHNLNQEMQHALQRAWPDIAAPLAAR